MSVANRMLDRARLVVVHDFFLQDLAKPLNGEVGYGVVQLFHWSQSSRRRLLSDALFKIAQGAVLPRKIL
jgi:hypothetical protein